MGICRAGSRVDCMDNCKVFAAALTDLFCQWSAQMAAALTMGSSSLIVTCKSWRICGHENWNKKEL